MKTKKNDTLKGLMNQLQEAAKTTKKVFVAEEAEVRVPRLSPKALGELIKLASHPDWECLCTTIIEGFINKNKYECTSETRFQSAMMPLIRAAALNQNNEQTNWEALLGETNTTVSDELRAILSEAMWPRSGGKVKDVTVTHFLHGDYTQAKTTKLVVKDKLTVIALIKNQATFDYSDVILPKTNSIEVEVYQPRLMREHIQVPIMEFNHTAPIHRNFSWKEESEGTMMEIIVDARFNSID